MAKRPSVIGRYQIVDRLGQGGMGSLYRAWDPMLERQIAIKLLRDDNDELRERFAREARSAARLRHRNIVTIFDVGEQDGYPFIAMEYIQGQTLGELIRGGAPISVLRKLQIIDELCDGLAFAHKAGIVHRDVKPPNVMVEHDGTVKILDFGIVRLAESGMTQAGMLIGTVNYMSPEQVAGRPVDLRSDIFAVGAVLYELLSCQQAFHGGLHNGILNRILHEPPHPLLELCPDLDAEIVRIVDQALEKDPAARYQDLSAMRNDLQRAEVQLGFVPSDSGRRHISDSDIINLQAPTAPASRPATPRRGAYREDLARRRASQIAAHLEHTQQALANGEFEVAMAAAEQALLLDAEEPEALDLLERARSALEERQLAELLSRGNELLQAQALTEAGQVADEAVLLAPEAAEAVRFQSAVEAARAARQQARARAAAVEGALKRARIGLAHGALAEAEAAVGEALALAPELAAVQELRELVRQAQEAVDRRAAEAVEAADALFQTGQEVEAVGGLERFEPAHPVVITALTRLRQEHERREDARRAAKARAEESAAAVAAARSTAGHEAAIELLELALGRDPEHAELSRLLMERRDALEAERRAARERRDKVHAAIETARRSESHEDAIAALQQALELEPEHAEAGRLLTERRAAHEREVVIASSLAEAQATAGHEAALEILRRAAALHPSHAGVREQLAAREAALAHERAEARRARERAEKSAAALAAARSSGSHPEAIRILEEALRIDVGHAALENDLAERRAALAEERRLAQERRDKVHAAIEGARRSKAHEDAIALLEQALELEPAHDEAHRLLSERRAAREREAAIARALADAQAAAGHEAALEILRRAAALDPTHRVVREQLTARETALEHERAEAQRARERAEKTAAALASAHNTASHEKALKILETALRADAGHAELETALRQRRSALDDERRARERRDKARAAIEKAKRSKSHDEAIASLEAALELEPRDAEAQRLLGERRRARELEQTMAAALAEAQQTPEHGAALAILRRAAALDPANRAVREQLAGREAALERERVQARLARERAENTAAALNTARDTASHADAIGILEAALRFDSGHSELQKVLAERRAAHDDEQRVARERREKVAATLAEAARTPSHQAAIELLQGALSLEPANTEVGRLLHERQAALDQEREAQRRAAEREAAVAALLAEARETASHEEALGILRRAAALDPRHRVVRDQLAARGGELERERAEARQARERAKQVAAAIAAAESAASHEIALNILQEALTLDPANAELGRLVAARRAAHEEEVRLARERRARVHAAIEKARHTESHEEAIALLDEALALEPTHVSAWRLRTERREALEREQEAARRAQERAAVIAAAVTEAAATASHEAAVGILQRAAALDPAHAGVREQLAGREAALAAERTAARQLAERRARVAAAVRGAEQAASHDAAIRTLEAALAVDPGESELEGLLGQRRAAQEEERRAAEARRQRVATAVAAAAAASSHEAAIELLEGALALEPANGEVQQQLRARRTALEAAREAARQAEAREARVRSAIAAATALASHEKAVVLLERAVAVDPGQARLQTLLTDRRAALDREREEIRQQKERSDKAAALIKQAKTTASHDAALALLAEALALDPERPETRGLQATRQAALERQRAEEQRQAELAAARQTISELIDRQQFAEADTAIAQAKATLNPGKTLKDLERRLAKAGRAHASTAAASTTKEILHGVPPGVPRPRPVLGVVVDFLRFRVELRVFLAAAGLLLTLGGAWWLTTRGSSSQTATTGSEPAAAPPVAAPSSAPPVGGSLPSSTATTRSDPPVPAPVNVPPTGSATPAEPSAPSPSVDIASLVGMGRRQLARGELAQSLSTIAPGLQSDPQHPELRKLLSEIVVRSRRQALTARTAAGRHGEPATGQNAYRDGNSKFQEATKLERAGQSQQAATLFSDAAALFDNAEKAARESLARAAAPDPTPTRPSDKAPTGQPSTAPPSAGQPSTGQQPTGQPSTAQPSAGQPPAGQGAAPTTRESAAPATVSPPPKPAAETTPAPVEPRPGPVVNPPPKPSPASAAADEASIRNTLRAYQQGYTNRDVNEIRRVYPSVDAARLRRSFDDMRSQEMRVEISEPISITGDTATVIGQVHISLTPRAGSRYTPPPFRGVFRLQKVGGSWVILEQGK